MGLRWDRVVRMAKGKRGGSTSDGESDGREGADDKGEIEDCCEGEGAYPRSRVSLVDRECLAFIYLYLIFICDLVYLGCLFFYLCILLLSFSPLIHNSLTRLLLSQFARHGRVKYTKGDVYIHSN
jgi:hypothetical protein